MDRKNYSHVFFIALFNCVFPESTPVPTTVQAMAAAARQTQCQAGFTVSVRSTGKERRVTSRTAGTTAAARTTATVT